MNWKNSRVIGIIVVPLILFNTYGCSLLKEVRASTSSIHQNRMAVDMSTGSIGENIGVVQSSTHAILANEQAIRRATQIIIENGAIIQSSNRAIKTNESLIARTNTAIDQNAQIISKSTQAIQDNMSAVEQSSATIMKNAQAIEHSTEMLKTLKVNPGLAKLIGLILAILLIGMPLLMVIFMWRIHRDLRMHRGF